MERTANLWIGLRQKQDENTKQFTWVGETPVMYTNWRSGQPDRSITKVGLVIIPCDTALVVKSLIECQYRECDNQSYIHWSVIWSE